jgi:hypothetical protein
MNHQIIPIKSYQQSIYDFTEELISRDAGLLSFTVSANGMFFKQYPHDSLLFSASFKGVNDKIICNKKIFDRFLIEECFELIDDVLPPGIPIKRERMSTKGKDILRNFIEHMINDKTTFLLRQDKEPTP